ncbi:MAG: response regulator [Candidatus Niyogibacteria bacterium]|nr:response regulator [Candidatus Niyogibacteria bacterium]
MAKILIAEDDQALSSVLKKKLEMAGHEVSLAPDGEEALEKMRSFRPDLVLLDIIMPKVNGYEVLERMQSDPGLKGMNVIIISNSGQPVELERAIQLGAKDFLIKASFEPNEVLEKINEHLGAPMPSGSAADAGKEREIKTQSYSVLIVEDDKFLRDLLSLKLKKEGFNVYEAVDGEDGLSKTRSEKPNVIILDLIIPVLDGFAFLETLKKDPSVGSIPVIVLSNLGQREDIDRAKSLGARDYMIKAQLTPIEVVERIKSVLRESYI